MTLNKLNNKIIQCRNCDRLVNFREKIATEKRRQYIDQNYWGKPITGYGDVNAQLLMIGLAPAAHGGNRTGRVFTGDKSADFLFKCLHKSGFANQSNSISRDDGLVLFNLYLTTALKCVPPEDKPKPDELKTCFKFFKEELNNNSPLTKGLIVFGQGSGHGVGMSQWGAQYMASRGQKAERILKYFYRGLQIKPFRKDYL